MSKGKFEKATKDNYTLQEIERTLKNKDKMYAYAETGDMEILHILIDAETALMQSQPTEIQLKTVELVYRRGLTLGEAGKLLGVSPQGVKFNLDLLKVKIKRVLNEWELIDREGVA